MRRMISMAAARGRRQSAEPGDYFASMTDLMLGLVFVFIIMLMGFVLNLHAAAQKPVAPVTVVALPEADLARRELLHDMARLLQGTLPVTIDENDGTLRLGGDILFPRGSADAYPEALLKLQRLAAALGEVLPCYAVAIAPSPQCASKHEGRLDAVYIEGHTDTTPIHTARFQNNWELSAARAAVTFEKLVEAAPALALLKNDKGERLIGVSGYGEFRPIDPGNSESAMQKNRRIELRFVMVAPNSTPFDALGAPVDRHRDP